ncbi:hypothetical protein GH714_017182 [Hevea brasiliensis]|uniref:MLO-like protein n=1 Tax=Hevea brasiliensis TaxID=3981 RepID=A0A6A6NIX5_HEVBR|nr:hypothetical protein GH714_017182 [Hevea brasiliensis]
MAAAAPGDRSLQNTPTWALAGVCAVFVIISILIEHGIHSLGKWFQKRHNKAMSEALEKIKAELMLLGFISLLLTVGTKYIAKICIPPKYGDRMLPCKPDYEEEDSKDKGKGGGGGDDDYNDRRKLLSFAGDVIWHRVLAAAPGGDDYCGKKNKISLISQTGVHQLHIFIFVLAVFHVLYSVMTMALAQAKMKKLKAWELETSSLEYQFTNDPSRFRLAHQTSFVKRHSGISTAPGIRWIVAFFRQFFGSVTKVDYLTMRNGFINAHFAPNSKFDFHKYIKRCMEDDFKVVVGISIPLWIFAIVFLLLNVYKWYTLTWLTIVPLIILLLVGTKLELVIMEMAQEIQARTTVVRGAPVVEPNNKYFWFNRPQWILFLLHYTLFQIVAITVFFLLSVAYYAFFAPFLGKDIYEYVAVGVYSVLALAVFILYVRCTAIDPADPGILLEVDETAAHKSQNDMDLPGNASSIEEPSKMRLKDGGKSNRNGSSWCSNLGGFFCGFLVKQDCCSDEDILQQQSGEEALFCTLCNAEAVCTAVSFLATVPLGELFFFHMILIRKGITTYEYVVAMRTQSEPPGPSVDGGDQQSLPSSPTSSAVTAASGRSSIGMSLQYKALQQNEVTCNNFWMFEQDEIIPHLEPGRLPSTVDPDATQEADKGKKLPHRPVRISAWKLAKLDSNEAIKAAAKARASSSVLRPISSRHHPYDTDHLSSSNVSGKSSPISTDQGFHNRNARTGTSRVSPSRSNSYAPSNVSHASRDDIEACNQSLSNISSVNVSNLTTSPLHQQTSNREHLNPIYQSSENQSPFSTRRSEATGNAPQENVAQIHSRRNLGAVENLRTSVYWDPEAGRFVSSSSRGVGSSQVPGAELLYTNQSIFFGGPLANEPLGRGTRSSSSVAPGLDRGSALNHYQQGRSQRGGQLPVFVPSDSQQNQSSSRLP